MNPAPAVTPPSTATPYANPEPRLPGCPPEFVPLESIIAAELERTPKAPKPNGQTHTPSYCLMAAGKELAAPFVAFVPDRDQPVLVTAVLDRTVVYTFSLDGSGTRLVINIIHVRADPDDVRWVRGRPWAWGHESGQDSG